jgi:spore photoproduct lyase
MDKSVEESHKHLVKAEVIFLTHNENKHLYNLENNIPGEDLLWIPHLQEQKVSQTGGKNLRYKREFKHNLIRKWLKIHQEVIPWNQVRYVF